MEEWRWNWLGEGADDTKVSRGRVYYEAISAYRKSDGVRRQYQLGDVVIMSGEDQESWLAQIVEMFQVEEDDAELQEILRQDSSRNPDSAHHYEFMRVTLRWFYNREDITKESLRRSKVPKPIAHEFYFSDHVEKDGYNDVTVIEGLAFMVESAVQRDAFLRDPDPRFDETLDMVAIVRCFVNSNVEDYELRQLEKGELKFLLEHPIKDKNLYENSRRKFLGKGKAGGPILKGLHKKRKRVGRAPVNLEDIDDDVYEPSSKRHKSPSRVRSNEHQSKKKTKHERRRKHVVEDDDDDEPIALNADDTDDDVPIMDLSAKQAQELNEATDEVLDLVSELNANASLPRAGKVNREPKDGNIRIDPEYGVLPKDYNKTVKKKKSTDIPIGTIELIDTDEDDEPIEPKRKTLQPIVSKRERTSQTTSRRPDKPRPSFMPTARDRKVTADARSSPQMASPPKLAKRKSDAVETTRAKKDNTKPKSLITEPRVSPKGSSGWSSPQKSDVKRREEYCVDKQANVEKRVEKRVLATVERSPLQEKRERASAEQKKGGVQADDVGRQDSEMVMEVEEQKSPMQPKSGDGAAEAEAEAKASKAERNSRSESTGADRRSMGLGTGVRSRTSRAMGANKTRTQTEPEKESQAMNVEIVESGENGSKDTWVSPVAKSSGLGESKDGNLENEGNSPPVVNDNNNETDGDVDMSSDDDDGMIPLEGDTIGGGSPTSNTESGLQMGLQLRLMPITEQLKNEYPTYIEPVQDFIRDNIDFMFQRVRSKVEERGIENRTLEGEPQREVWKEIAEELRQKLVAQGAEDLAKGFEPTEGDL